MRSTGRSGSKRPAAASPNPSTRPLQVAAENRELLTSRREPQARDDDLPAAAEVEAKRRLVVRLRGENGRPPLEAFEYGVVEAAAESAPAHIRVDVELHQLEVARGEPAAPRPGVHRAGDDVVPPLPGGARVAEDDPAEPVAGRRGEEAEAFAPRMPRQRVLDALVVRPRPDLDHLLQPW